MICRFRGEEMINFDENKMIKNGEYIYNQRDKIESIADSICQKGFDLLFFTSSGGSMAMMEPFSMWVNQTPLQADSMISADMLLTGCNRLSDKTVAFFFIKIW